MVYGLEKFKEYFKDFSSYYVFIGGTACDILMGLFSMFEHERDNKITIIILYLIFLF